MFVAVMSVGVGPGVKIEPNRPVRKDAISDDLLCPFEPGMPILRYNADELFRQLIYI